MLDEDKATTTIPDSPAQKMLNKADRSIHRAIIGGIVMLFVVAALNVFAAVRLQYIIDKNQEDVIQARQANIERQSEQKDYIKCVLLLRFDATPQQLATREGASKALDECAQRVQ